MADNITTVHGELTNIDKQGNVVVLYPTNTSSDVIVNINNAPNVANALGTDDKTVQKVIDKLGTLAFKSADAVGSVNSVDGNKPDSKTGDVSCIIMGEDDPILMEQPIQSVDGNLANENGEINCVVLESIETNVVVPTVADKLGPMAATDIEDSIEKLDKVTKAVVYENDTLTLGTENTKKTLVNGDLIILGADGNSRTLVKSIDGNEPDENGKINCVVIGSGEERTTSVPIVADRLGDLTKEEVESIKDNFTINADGIRVTIGGDGVQETELRGRIFVRSNDGVVRRIRFNSNGTITWEPAD